MRKCKIYVLKDPNTNEVRYVGRTLLPLSTRLNSHKRTVGSKNEIKKEWLDELALQGKQVIIEEIEEVDVSLSARREYYWIEKYRIMGCRLINKNKPSKMVVHKERPNGGRMRQSDHKVPIGVYARKSEVEAIGGIDACREIILKYLNDELDKVENHLSGVTE